jgi:L-2-hydroxyglutarate oxidase LhgO
MAAGARVRIGIVGAGILGLAVARRLTELVPEAELTVLEKEHDCAVHQTGHNSGVMHAGVYYPEGSLKATLCRRGIDLLKSYCDEHGVPYDECGKVIVARSASEVPRLDEIERRARANGVPGLRRLTRDQLAEVEPHATGVDGLHSPSTAIVDFKAVARAIAAELERGGVTMRFGFHVSSIERGGGEIRIGEARTGEGLAFDRVVLCGGLQSDRLARLAGDGPDPVIVPFRGEYHRLLPSRSDLVRGLIYPVPDPAFPFLGVHFTRRIDGTVDIGPNAVLALAREGYRRRDVSLTDARDIIFAPGFRRLARQHWRVGLSEIHGSLSRRAFVAEAQTFVPELRPSDVVPAPAGVRAQAIDPDGALVDDFRITDADGIIVVRNAPSPAATSSLAIAEYIAPQVLGRAPQPIKAPQ